MAYCKIDRMGYLFLVIFTALIGAMISIWPILSHKVLSENASIAHGPCFVSLTDGDRGMRMKTLNNPANYSGYSVIVDTVYNHESNYIPEKPEAQETMIINGKEYILR